MTRAHFLWAVLLCLLLAPATRAEPPITVFAAASLRGALDEATAGYPEPVAISYGGSGLMARQLANGAPADLVILANPQWIDWLAQRGAILPDSRIDLLRNRLVVVGPKDAPALDSPTAETLLTALNDGRLAIGQRDSVPAGIYAKAWLEHIGAWSALAPHLAETDNVRAALALVSRGEAPLGIVYASDALADPSVDVVWQVPEDQHPKIIYPAAAVTERGRTLLDQLQRHDAIAAYVKYGFHLPEGRK